MPSQEPRRPSLRLIATKAGVSHTTVSLALRDDSSIPLETRETIKRLADSLGYRPDPVVAKVLSGLRYQKDAGRVLGYLHGFPDDEWKDHPTMGQFYRGAKRRAEMLGYRLDSFGLHPKLMTTKRAEEVLRARGIGGLLVGGLRTNRGHLSFNFEGFSAVAAGTSIIRPQLHRVVNHQTHSIQMAFRKLRHLGNLRIGLVVPDWIDARSDRNWYGGYCAFQRGLPKSQIVPAHMPEKMERGPFMEWLRANNVNALLLLDDNPLRWLQEEGVKVPDQLQIAHLDRSPIVHGELSGIDQRHGVSGETAVDLLLGEMYLNAQGVPENPRTILIESTWVDSETTFNRRTKAADRT